MGNCNTCNKPWCGKCPQPTNPSNKTVVVPVAGASAYKEWLSYNPELDPQLNSNSPWTEVYWLNNYAKGEKGDKGDGVQIKGSVPTYSDLSDIEPTPSVGDSWVVDADGLLYVYGINGFPIEGQGIVFTGQDGDTYIPITTTDYFDQ